MKKIYLITVFAFIAGFARAQEDISSEKKQQNIEALKVAFISKELELTPDEAQKFWPVYNQYSKELNNTLRDEKDVLVRDEKILNLRKSYKDQFSKVLGQERMNRIYNSEGRFRQLLIKANMRNQNRQNKANRQTPKRNF
jgi:hypothetical protein